jgi:hypothetical protein
MAQISDRNEPKPKKSFQAEIENPTRPVFVGAERAN